MSFRSMRLTPPTDIMVLPTRWRETRVGKEENVYVGTGEHGIG
jgi:hypothetical protein